MNQLRVAYVYLYIKNLYLTILRIHKGGIGINVYTMVTVQTK